MHRPPNLSASIKTLRTTPKAAMAMLKSLSNDNHSDVILDLFEYYISGKGSCDYDVLETFSEVLPKNNRNFIDSMKSNLIIYEIILFRDVIDFNYTDHLGQTMYFIRPGNASELFEILSLTCDINKRDNTGMSFLHKLAESNFLWQADNQKLDYIYLFYILTNRNFNFNLRDNSGRTVLLKLIQNPLVADDNLRYFISKIIVYPKYAIYRDSELFIWMINHESYNLSLDELISCIRQRDDRNSLLIDFYNSYERNSLESDLILLLGRISKILDDQDLLIMIQHRDSRGRYNFLDLVRTNKHSILYEFIIKRYPFLNTELLRPVVAQTYPIVKQDSCIIS